MTIKNYYFILQGKTPIAVSREDYYAKGENIRCAVKQEQVGDAFVSTVFLGVNHNLYDDEGNPPILFETMIFGGKLDDYQERYCTWDDAIAGHQKAVCLAKIEDRRVGEIPDNLFDLMRMIALGYQIGRDGNEWILEPSPSLMSVWIANGEIG